MKQLTPAELKLTTASAAPHWNPEAEDAIAKIDAGLTKANSADQAAQGRARSSTRAPSYAVPASWPSWQPTLRP